MHSSKLTKCLPLLVSFHYHLVRCCKLRIHIGEPQFWCIQTGYNQEGLHMELKMTNIDFANLNIYVIITYLRFTKSLFYMVKQKNLKGCIFPFHLSLYIRCGFFQATRYLISPAVIMIMLIIVMYENNNDKNNNVLGNQFKIRFKMFLGLKFLLFIHVNFV